MRGRLTISLLLFVAVSLFAIKAICDTPIAGIDKDTASGDVRYYATDAFGRMYTIPATGSAYILSTQETVTCRTLGSADSGTSCNPAAPSNAFCLNNASTGTIFVRLDNTAASFVGQRLITEANWCSPAPIAFSTMSVYNASSGAATVSITFWRFP